MEKYFRHIIYRRWVEGDIYRPFLSVPTLLDAVEAADKELAEGYDVKVIDVEHLDMGDMLNAEACADLVAQMRALIAERT